MHNAFEEIPRTMLNDFACHLKRPTTSAAALAYTFDNDHKYSTCLSLMCCTPPHQLNRKNCIDICSSCQQKDRHKKMTASLRSLVLLQPLWMQLMYYLAESVIRTRRILLLARHNMGCYHFSRTAGVKADYMGM